MGVEPSSASSQPVTDAGTPGNPVAAISVYWVGHSLVEAKARSAEGETDLMTMVGALAKERALGYRMFDHTLWGSPLSALWRGRPHSYDRDADAMIAKREAFERNAAIYDTLVLTEGLPVARALDTEYSAYYLRRFYCTLKAARPDARVFLYQTWVNYQGNDPYAGYPPLEQFDWRAEMSRQRAVWEELADTAASPTVRTPHWLSKLGYSPSTDAGCTTTDPIMIVPVGNVLTALADRLSNPRAQDRFVLPDGSRFALADLFSNPYVEWPAKASGTNAENAAVAGSAGEPKVRDPSRPHDDIHPSALGIYVSALVHFATLYRQSPVGLSHPAKVGADLAHTLQCIVWQTVIEDPRSGVSGTYECPPR